MPKALSDDLRCRILEAYERKEGSRRELALRFGVSFDYVRKIRRQFRKTEKMERAAQSRHGPLSRITDSAQATVARLAAGTTGSNPCRTGRAVAVGRGRGEPEPHQPGAPADGSGAEKKSIHAHERDTEANRKRREDYLAEIATIPPERLIFLDESGVTTQMTRAWGRAPRGQRIVETTPGGHWQVLTTIGSLSLRGIGATMTIESATDGDVFSE